MNRRELIKLSVVTAIGVMAGLTGRVLPARASNVVGRWSPVISWPDVAIHLNLLPSGEVLSFADDDHADFATKGTRNADFTKAFVVKIPPMGGGPYAYTYIPNTTTNLFCCGHCLLPDGRIITLGGHEGRDGDGSKDVNILQKGGQYTWQRQGNDPMAFGRWYPSAIPLNTGHVLVIGGSEFHHDEGSVKISEVYNPNANRGKRLRTLTGAVFEPNLPLYSPVYAIQPNRPNGLSLLKGDVFMPGHNQETYFLNTSGAGAWSYFNNRVHDFSDYGSSALYDTNKVLMVGGGDPPRNTAEVINLNENTTPTWRETNSMRYARRHANCTILADGKVLVTGGTSSPGFNNGSAPVLPAEIWDPNTGVWTEMASMQVGRFYHSTALLLPDGRVLSAGGGRPAAINGADNKNAEIFSPPYLFSGGGGTFADRPSITSAPTSVGYGQQFVVQTNQAPQISQVTWVGLSATTHTFNSGQRFMRLTFGLSSANALQVWSPSISNLAPPGYYMLFILNGNGVPSVARIVRLG